MNTSKKLIWASTGILTLGVLGCGKSPQVTVSQSTQPPPPAAPVPSAVPVPDDQAQPAADVEPGAPDAQDVYVDQEPPAPLVEVQPVSPGPDYFWIGGYWNWDPVHRHYLWIKGRYDRAPERGASWVAPRYERDAHGIRYSPGRWNRPGDHAEARPGAPRPH